MAVQREMREQNDSGLSSPDNGGERPRAERSGAMGQTAGSDDSAGLAALAASEARYRLAVDAARLGTWAWDVHTDIATFDDRVRELLGLADENARSRASIIESGIHPDWEKFLPGYRVTHQPAGAFSS